MLRSDRDRYGGIIHRVVLLRTGEEGEIGVRIIKLVRFEVLLDDGCIRVSPYPDHENSNLFAILDRCESGC